jgi:hypothetical protein
MPAPQRLTAIVVLLVPLCGIAATTPPPAWAQPACEYALSAPQLTTLNGGVTQITARLTVTSCADGAFPSKNVVCLSGAGSNGRCAFAWGWNAAQVFVDPGGPAPYVSTGKGCVTVASGQLPESTCTPLGPVTER